ncbi:MAG TPA: prepilin-type N-terminal cleavage/methylation domain-containing protein [Candidatus Omnitrophica bacterium]|nr:prepilin-type N-terminal cleavage/methylation domain-containing protein [Candidatus Omnitrophota bacterium]
MNRILSLLAKGFTLLELLISLAITSIIFLVLFSSYSSTINTIETWDDREQNYYLARNIFRRMKAELSSIYYTSELVDENQLEGKENSLTFYTTAGSLYFPFSGLTKVTYEFRLISEGNGVLTRKEEPFLNFALEENRQIKSYIWTEDLKDLNFGYSDGENWFNEWNLREKKEIPQAIKIILTSPYEEIFPTVIYISYKRKI